MINKEKKLWVFGFLLIVALSFFFGYTFSGLKSEKELQSQCFTNLRATNYFGEDRIFTLEDGGIEVFPYSDYSIGIIPNTGSMRPSLPDGSRVIIVDNRATSIRRGDIVLGDPEKEISVLYNGKTIKYNGDWLHRVVDIENEFSGNPIYITKGDNNQERDPFTLNSSRIKGIVVGVLY